MLAATPSWFAGAIAEVNAALAAQRLAHGLWIHEDPGTGGLELARWIAQRVNCAAPRTAPADPRQTSPCGECQSCKWIEADQHPDVAMLSPGEDSEYIKVEPVRELIADLALTAHGRGYKIAILSPADALYPNAANSLLKTLEEPPARTILMLVTSKPARLLPTLRSRCSRLRLPGPSRKQAAEFLAAARGSGPWEEALATTGAGPFALLDADATALAELRADTLRTLHDIGTGNLQPPAVSDKWARGELGTRLACVESWVTDRILESTSIRDVTHLSGSGLAPNICRLFELSDAVRDMRKLSHTSINKAMAVEALLWRWAGSERRGASS
jgi:DNA polymerase-3 subunit delta'